MRDKMIHQYFGVDLALVWDVVARELPNLRRGAEEVLKELGTVEDDRSGSPPAAGA